MRGFLFALLLLTPAVSEASPDHPETRSAGGTVSRLSLGPTGSRAEAARIQTLANDAALHEGAVFSSVRPRLVSRNLSASRCVRRPSSPSKDLGPPGALDSTHLPNDGREKTAKELECLVNDTLTGIGQALTDTRSRRERGRRRIGTLLKQTAKLQRELLGQYEILQEHDEVIEDLETEEERIQELRDLLNRYRLFRAGVIEPREVIQIVRKLRLGEARERKETSDQ